MAAPDSPNPLRVVIDNATEAQPAEATQGGRADPPSGSGSYRLPPDAPITALGVEGKTCHYLDELGQHAPLEPRDHSRNHISHMCGRRKGWLFQWAPRHAKDGGVTGYDVARVSDAMMGSCAEKGPWSAAERLRGAGAWLRSDGSLILHSGDRVLLCGDKRARDEWREPGLIDEHVYPTSSPILRPWPSPVPGGSTGAGAEVMALFGSWRWKYPSRDPRLLLGWIGASMVAGAVDWRPVLWITGDPGTGKSTLLRSIKGMLGGALLSVGDASAAGIWQHCGYSSLPVALDELEAGEDDRRAQSILRLIRNAASGTELLRGGADHIGARFTLRSCFMASSVLPPAMSKADRSRIAILELQELGKTELPPDTRPDRLRDLGAKLLRRMVDGWPRWNDTLAMYRAAFGRRGYSARGADVFGTLLSSADLLLDDAELNSDFADEKVAEITAATLADDDLGSDQELCLQHLMTSLLPPDGPNRRNVGHWVGDMCDAFPALTKPPALLSSGDHAKIEAANLAREVLATYGLKVAAERDGRRYLYIANSHQALSRLFQGTRWAGQAGTTSVWRQSLARLPGALASTTTVRFDKAATARATLIPIEKVYQPDEPAERALAEDGGSDA